jgi:hypothetical protein
MYRLFLEDVPPFSHQNRGYLATSVANLLLSRRPMAQSFSNSACSLSACCFKEASAPCGTMRQHDAQIVSVD